MGKGVGWDREAVELWPSRGLESLRFLSVTFLFIKLRVPRRSLVVVPLQMFGVKDQETLSWEWRLLPR